MHSMLISTLNVFLYNLELKQTIETPSVSKVAFVQDAQSTLEKFREKGHLKGQCCAGLLQRGTQPNQLAQ